MCKFWQSPNRNLFTSQRVPSLSAKLISRIYTSVSLYSNNSEFNNKIKCSGLWKACMPRVLSFLLLFLLVTVHVTNHGSVHSLKILPGCFEPFNLVFCRTNSLNEPQRHSSIIQNRQDCTFQILWPEKENTHTHTLQNYLIEQNMKFFFLKMQITQGLCLYSFFLQVNVQTYT